MGTQERHTRHWQLHRSKTRPRPGVGTTCRPKRHRRRTTQRREHEVQKGQLRENARARLRAHLLTRSQHAPRKTSELLKLWGLWL
jgi:hypothetical protein